MFCDLVGSTGISSRLDPEDLREVFGKYHKDVATVVGRYDGFVAKYMGDGVFVTTARPVRGCKVDRPLRSKPVLGELWQ